MGVHGQTAPFTEVLGLEQDLYSAGSLYNDPYAVSLTNAHDLLIDGKVRELRLATNGSRRGVERALPIGGPEPPGGLPCPCGFIDPASARHRFGSACGSGSGVGRRARGAGISRG